jgi:hypothetical protein
MSEALRKMDNLPNQQGSGWLFQYIYPCLHGNLSGFARVNFNKFHLRADTPAL